MRIINKPAAAFLLTALCLSLSACKKVEEPPAETMTAIKTEAVTTAEITTVTEAETTEETKSEIENMVEEMSLEEKVGQLLLARFPQENAAETAEKYHIGGFTFYAEDFKGRAPQDILAITEDIRSRAKIPPLFAVDEEGGKVVRISSFSAYRRERFHSQLELAEGGLPLIESETKEKAELLLSMGINLNLAPVADVADSSSDYIYSRTFGADPKTTGEYVSRIVEVMNDNGVGSCLKHFPGYGSNADTHTGISVDKRSADSFREKDFIPFEYGINAGVPSVMVCHNIVEAFDGERPASLSAEVHRLLREELDFKGVIISDDMGMDAVKLYSGEESPYVLGVLAGNDLICTSDIPTAYEAILAAVKNGRIPEEAVDESCIRILEMKKSLNIYS